MRITQKAHEKLQLLSGFLRVQVIQGGCSGLQYSFAFEKEAGDEFIYVDGVKIIMSLSDMPYLEDVTLDFKQDFGDEYFVIENPKARASCACGRSFSR